jgi:glycosyltransferase involved in cell wall biosynthesis
VVASWYPSPEQPYIGLFIRAQACELARACDVALVVPRMVSWRRVVSGRWGPRQWVEQAGPVPVFGQRWCQPFPRFPAAWSLAASVRAVEGAFETLVAQFGRPDVLHAHVALPGGYAAVKIGQRHSIPVVLTEHTGPLPEFVLNSALTREVFSQALHGARRVIGVSPEMQRQIAEFDPGVPVTIVPNVVRTRFFVPATESEPADRFTFFLMGLLVERKGGRYLIEAVRQLVRGGCRGFRVVIGGDGAARRPWQQLVAEHGLEPYIEFLGAIGDAEVLHQMQHCDVFVLPSLHENFGVVLGEAMACGKPVLATRCGGSEFVVTPDSGILVPPADAPALADAMQGFLDRRYSFDPTRIRASVVDRFGEDAFLARLTELYRDVLAATG